MLLSLLSSKLPIRLPQMPQILPIRRNAFPYEPQTTGDREMILWPTTAEITQVFQVAKDVPEAPSMDDTVHSSDEIGWNYGVQGTITMKQ